MPPRRGSFRAFRSGEGPKFQISRLERVPNFLCHGALLHCLDQHGAALPATDAFCGNAALAAKPSHCVDEMQYDSIAACADRMSKANRATIDIDLVAVDYAGGFVEMQHLAAEFAV